MPPAHTIGIVDDDDGLRDSLALILRFRDFNVIEYSSGEELIDSPRLQHLDCIILDLFLTGMDGLEVVEICKERGVNAPIIVVTAFGSVSAATRALKLGAHDFLEKPVHEEEMVRAVNEALSHSGREAALRNERRLLQERLATLSLRERQVLDAVLDGRHNREIAASLKLSVRTIEVYKARVMEKMCVSRLAELIRLFVRFELFAL